MSCINGTEKLTACPHCGGELQATQTRESWFSFRDGKWASVGEGEGEGTWRIYCENDHEIDLSWVPSLDCFA